MKAECPIWASTFAAPALVVTALLTFYCYLPVVIENRGTDTLMGNKNVVAQPWGEFLAGIWPHLEKIHAETRRDVPLWARVACLLLAGLGYWRAWRRRDFALMTLAPAMLAGGIAVFFWKHRIPFTRTWIYLIPVLLLYGDAGFTWLTGKLPRRAGMAACIAVILAGGVYAGHLIRNNTIIRYPDTGAMLGAEQVALKIIEMKEPEDVVTAKIPADSIVYYYMLLHHGKYRSLPGANSKRQFFVVRKGRYRISDLTDRPTRLILDLEKAQLHVVELTTQTQSSM